MTIDWYKTHEDWWKPIISGTHENWWKPIISGEYQNYYQKMYGNRKEV